MKEPVRSEPKKLFLTSALPGEVLLARQLKIHSLSVLKPNMVEYLPGSAVGIKRYEIKSGNFWRHVRYQDEAPLYQQFFSSIRHFRYGFALVVKQEKCFHINPAGKAAYRWRFIDATDVRYDGTSLVQHSKRAGWHIFNVVNGYYEDGWPGKK